MAAKKAPEDGLPDAETRLYVRDERMNETARMCVDRALWCIQQGDDFEARGWMKLALAADAGDERRKVARMAKQMEAKRRGAEAFGEAFDRPVSH